MSNRVDAAQSASEKAIENKYQNNDWQDHYQ